MRGVLPVTSMLLRLIRCLGGDEGRVGAVTFAVDGGKLIHDVSVQTVTLRISFYRAAIRSVPITRIRVQVTDIFTFMWSKHKTAV